MENESNPSQNSDHDDSISEEEYNIWKQNTPFLYHTMLSHSLPSPSITVQWMPPTSAKPTILYGTNASNYDTNFLYLAEVDLPDITKNNKLDGAIQPETSSALKLTNIITIPHNGEINKARCCPQNASIIASKTISGEINLYDTANLKSGKKLIGHKKEGFGLSWSQVKAGYLASSAKDNLICIWDTYASTINDRIDPLIVLDGHHAIVGDVCFHKKQSDILASVDDNKRVFLWDLRKGSKPISIAQDHHGEIYCVDFNPLDENLYATGSEDKSIMIWDMRKMNNHLASLEYHSDNINALQWSPKNVSILASCGNDKKVCIWDISQLGAEMSKEDYEDGPAELLFVHAGHIARINDLCWKQDSEYMICSTSEDNILQIWQMASEIYRNECLTPKHIKCDIIE